MPQLMVWVKGTLQRPNIIFYGTVLPFPPLLFFTTVKNDSYKGNQNSKNRKKPWERLLNNFPSWLGIGEIENRPRMLTFQPCPRIRFGFSTRESFLWRRATRRLWDHISFPWSVAEALWRDQAVPGKHLKETDYKKHKIHWFRPYLPSCYLHPQFQGQSKEVFEFCGRRIQ